MLNLKDRLRKLESSQASASSGCSLPHEFSDASLEKILRGYGIDPHNEGELRAAAFGEQRN